MSRLGVPTDYVWLKHFCGVENSKTVTEYSKEFVQHFYYPNMCQYCSAYNIERPARIPCKTCEVMFYCSDDHRIAHYNEEHKTFCKTLAILRGDKNHLYENCDLSDFRTRVNFIESAKAITPRDLKIYERKSFMFPRVCMECNESNPNQLSPCLHCICGTFCNNHSYKIILHRKNDERCDRFNLLLYVDNLWLVFKDLPLEYTIRSLSFFPTQRNIPVNMETFMDVFITPFQQTIELYWQEIAFEAVVKVVSTVFTRSLTLVYALKLLGKEIWCKGNKDKVIYVISKEEKFAAESSFSEFEILLHWFSRLKKLTVVFIGCETPPPKTILTNVCGICSAEEKSLKIYATTKLFKEYYEGRKSKKPDIIVAYNVDYRTHNIWVGASSMLAELKIPIVLTAMDKTFLIAAAHDCVTDPRNFSRIEENPYKSLREERFLNSIASSNQFISIYDDKLFPKICEVDDPIDPCNLCSYCEMRDLKQTDYEEKLINLNDHNLYLNKKIINIDNAVLQLKQNQASYDETLMRVKTKLVDTFFSLEDKVSSVLEDFHSLDTEALEPCVDGEDDGS